MRYFKPSEFGNDWPVIAPALKDCLDAFRADWGAPVRISPRKGALGRRLGPEEMSGHNIDRWGTVMAADVFPAGMDTPDDMARAVSCAKTAGATGVGLYTDTSPSKMMHLDVRPDRTPDNPRYWSRVEVEEDGEKVKVYQAIEIVLPKGWERP